MKRVFHTVLVLFLLSTFVFAGEPVINGSTEKTFTTSFTDMASSTGKEKGTELMKAYMKIAKSINLGELKSEEEAKRKSLEAMRKKLDGKTFDQIITIAKELPDDPELEKAMEDFKKMGTSSVYQHDADIVRLKHLKYLGGIIEEFKEKTGEYPLVNGSPLQNYVHIASSHQQEYAQSGGPPYEHTKTGMREFKKILERGLNRKIDLPFDPQTVAVNKPNFYIYMTERDRYFLSVHLHDGEGVGRKVGPYYYKAEISNVSIPNENIFTYKKLLTNRVFSKRINESYTLRPPKNPEQADLLGL